MNTKNRREDVLKNGLVGELKGYRIGGRTFDPEGNEIADVHEENCFCCRKQLHTPTTKQ